MENNSEPTPVGIDFALDVENGKYTVRVYKNGGFDVLRYGDPWIDESFSIRGAKMWTAMIFELHAYRSGHGTARALMPRELAREFLEGQGLPRDGDGRAPLPVPIEKVEDMLARIVTEDRASGPIDPERIVKVTIDDQEVPEWATFTRKQVATFIRSAIKTAQARGARIRPEITEDDYAEASRAGHEAFMACLKDKGLYHG